MHHIGVNLERQGSGCQNNAMPSLQWSKAAVDTAAQAEMGNECPYPEMGGRGSLSRRGGKPHNHCLVPPGSTLPGLGLGCIYT